MLDRMSSRPIDDHDAFCVTVIRPHRPTAAADVVRRLGRKAKIVREVDLSGGWDQLPKSFGNGESPFYLLAQQGDSWVLWEENGFQGTRFEVLEALSQMAEVVGFYTNVYAATQLSFARDGQVLVTLDPFDPPDPAYRSGTEVHALDDQLGPLLAVHAAHARDDYSKSYTQPGLDLVEELGHVTLDAAWLNGRHLLVRATPLPEVSRGPVDPLADLLAAAPRETQWQVAHRAATAAAELTGAIDIPQVRTALETIPRFGHFYIHATPTSDYVSHPELEPVWQALAFEVVEPARHALPPHPRPPEDTQWRHYQSLKAVDAALDLITSPPSHLDGVNSPRTVLRWTEGAMGADWPQLYEELITRLSPEYYSHSGQVPGSGVARFGDLRGVRR